jgi:hypothetical protein
MWFLPQPKEGTVMIKDAQVRKLRQLLGEGHPLHRAALKVGIDANQLESTGMLIACRVNR